ncbi:serine/threonine protein kinase [bacterium]|nr:serine/threonine protein kinase [bacterium]
MSETISQKKLDAAAEFGFLSKVQVESLYNQRQESSCSVLKFAISKGLLNRQQLDILDIFAEPEDVVPGYRIDGFLGEGGVGTVYKGTQIRMDRPVAIKTIQRSSEGDDLKLKRFEQEARIVGQLRHPNVIPAFDFSLHKEHLYLIMEFVDGIDAEKRLSQIHRFPERHAWFIARQVCHALHNAKQLGIIHRDIKPGNLVLTEAPAGTPMPAAAPFVKVADFGLAKFSDRKMNAKLTAEKGVSGTPFYMSPEQIQSMDIDYRSDIYSLGATIWHLITGSPPFTGKTPLDVITCKMKLEDAWLEPTGEMSELGFQLLAKMCRHDREQRIDDYSELSQEIDAVIESLPEPEPQDGSENIITAGSSRSATITTIREFAKTLAEDSVVDIEDSQDFVLGDQDSTSISSAETGIFALTDDAGSTQESMQEIDSIGQPNRRGRSRALWPIVVVFGLLLIAAMSVANNFRSQSNSESASGVGASDQPKIRLSEFAGLPNFLFNGTMVDSDQKSSGTWEAAMGGDGGDGGSEGAVLAGLGTRDYHCHDLKGNPLRNFRFVCGFRHYEADLIEFKFISTESNSVDEEEMFRVTLKPDMATLLSGKIKNECVIQQFDGEKSFDPHQFRIESQPGYWRIEVDRELLGEVDKPKDFVGDDATIQLLIEGKGSAHFDGISFQEFTDEPDQQKM